MYFGTYRLQKTWLLDSLRSPISEQPRVVNILKGPKHCRNLRVFSYFFITLRKSRFEKVSI